MNVIAAVILIAKVRADARRRADAGQASLPSARVAGSRLRLAQRIHEPGAYAYGIGACALLSAMICTVLGYIHHRPDPRERRAYRIVNPLAGTVETRELTEQEFHDQYESVPDALKRTPPTSTSRPRTSTSSIVQTVATKCISGACVGHAAELTERCASAVTSLIEDPRSQVAPVDVEVMLFSHGRATRRQRR